MSEPTAQDADKKQKARKKRIQVGALCLDGQGRVLLITSRGSGRWVIPKGGVMRGKSNAEAALCEAREEAGVEGRIGAVPIGRYRYDKVLRDGRARPVTVQVFLAMVDRLAEDWLEAGERTRRWFSPAEAAGLVAEPDLQQLLRALPEPAG